MREEKKAAHAAVAGPKEAVAYLDIGEGGYLDLGSDLSDEALRKLPKGRHMLAIVGTYGVDGYVPVAAPTAVVRELKLLRGLASNRGDDDRIQEAEIDVARLQHIESAAMLALGILWMEERHSPKVKAAYMALKNALGGKKALGEAIADAADAGYEADHPAGATWWAGKKDCTHCSGTGDVHGEYPGAACHACGGSGAQAKEGGA